MTSSAVTRTEAGVHVHGDHHPSGLAAVTASMTARRNKVRFVREKARPPVEFLVLQEPRQGSAPFSAAFRRLLEASAESRHASGISPAHLSGV